MDKRFHLLAFFFGLIIILWGPPGAFGEYAAKGKRDPFVPLVTSEGQRIHPPGLDEGTVTGIAGLTLQGIVYDPRAESYAVINGRIVRQFDDIDGMKILKIDPAEVTIAVEGQRHKLTLRQPKEETKQK